MFRDERSATLNSPEGWAATFARSTRLNRWREWRLKRDPQYRLVQRFIPAGARVLDAGCGFGEWVMLLSRSGYNAEGIDYSADLVRRLRETYPDRQWQHGDIRNMPYASSIFDAITSWGVIEHDPAGPAAALQEFRRILRPGGTIVVSVPWDSIVARREAQSASANGSGFFQYLMTEDELASEVRHAGFEVTASGTLRYPSLNLAAPALARAAGHTRFFGIAAFAFANLMAWTNRYDAMVYCVGRAR